MNMLVIFIHVIACIALIAIVLLQTGKGAEMGAAFGGASQTLFGGSGGSSFLSKLTTGAAVVFMLTCLLLSYQSTAGTGRRSVMQDTPVEQPKPAQPQPALPDARPVQPEGSQAAPPQTQAPAQPTAATPAQQAAPDKAAPAAKEQPKQDKAPDKK